MNSTSTSPPVLMEPPPNPDVSCEPFQQGDQSDSKPLEDDYEDDEMLRKPFYVPELLNKAFKKELGGLGDTDSDCCRRCICQCLGRKLLVIAIHCVFIESGFIGFDMDSKSVVKTFQFRNAWPSDTRDLSLFYTLRRRPSSSNLECPVVQLDFDYPSKYMSLFGYLLLDSSAWTTTTTMRMRHGVQLNELESASYFGAVWANCGPGLKDKIRTDKGSMRSPEEQVIEFWRAVKDNLALPFLTDLCEEFGLDPLVPCFMMLPTDVKLKILELLRGDYVAKLGCVCQELRSLTSSEDLWEHKCIQEFGDRCKEPGPAGRGGWKQRFARCWRATPWWRKIQ
ncbi:OLC1v1003142C1 [Oldenlandia corymbosa var. corymbosa]|uniref:OLC1v1003142C1 n=1 Tax=Oldenlandia corymbosa var. corymbosa TaxID=529605 RepID=A0AAV1DB78_OLDCO|nr:OLC1v1003142C1 [Oldenlandia corymbosa var. corymbosa]